MHSMAWHEKIRVAILAFTLLESHEEQLILKNEGDKRTERLIQTREANKPRNETIRGNASNETSE